MAPRRISHAQISRALAILGERAGAAEVAAALQREWEPFAVQMRRRMRTRPRACRGAYLVLALAGAAKVRVHLEETGALPRCEEGRPRRLGIAVRVGDRRRVRRARAGRAGHCGGGR
jgi:hypothetical protein